MHTLKSWSTLGRLTLHLFLLTHLGWWCGCCLDILCPPLPRRFSVWEESTSSWQNQTALDHCELKRKGSGAWLKNQNNIVDLMLKFISFNVRRLANALNWVPYIWKYRTVKPYYYVSSDRVWNFEHYCSILWKIYSFPTMLQKNMKIILYSQKNVSTVTH